MNPNDLAEAKRDVEYAVFNAVSKALLPYEGMNLVFAQRTEIAHQIADKAGECIENLPKRLKTQSP